MQPFHRKTKVETVENEMCNVILHLNMRLMPMDRGTLFEDPIDEALHQYNIGEVTGGGTLLSQERMPLSCDIEFSIKKNQIDRFISFLKNADTMAKGSYIEYDDKREEIGNLEGLNLILDGTGLDESVYKENNVNDVIHEINHLLEGKGQYHSYYVGEKNTNLYFYGKSFDEMKGIIVPYTKTAPLCKNSIIEQV